MDESALEKVLRRATPRLEEERRALAGGRWEEYLRERLPPPSRIHFARRRAWHEAYDHAVALGHSSEEREVLVFPVWYCANEDDAESREWKPAVVVSHADPTMDEVYEDARINDSILVVARVEEVNVGYLRPSRIFSADVPLAYRNDHYAAYAVRRIDRVHAIERVVAAAPVPRPRRAVPRFSDDAEPAIALDAVEPTLAAQARRAVDKLKILTETGD